LSKSPAPWNPEECVWRLKDGEWSGQASDSAPDRTPWQPQAPPPAWLTVPLQSPSSAPAAIRPSAAGLEKDFEPSRGGKSLAETERALLAALDYGRLIHSLLMRLPSVAVEDRKAFAETVLGPSLDGAVRVSIVSQALSVIGHPAIQPLFAVGSVAEASIAGSISLPSGERLEINGRIDRLAMVENELWFADFKTGRAPLNGDAPLPYVRQLALYAAALAESFPSMAIRAFLIWTQGPRVFELSSADLRDALMAAWPEPAT